MIKLQCDCGNDNQYEFDSYVSPGNLCKVLTIVCRQCGEVREELIASAGDSIVLVN